jgi:hypothetical protein
MSIFRSVVAATVGVSLLTGTAWAGNAAKGVSPATLRSMGLTGGRVMTDSEGSAVRGRGHFAIVSGSATVGGTTKTYVHVAPPGHTVIGGTIVISGGTFAGGGAFATAK